MARASKTIAGQAVYEACGYRVYPGTPDAYGARYDVYDPAGRRITTVSSAQAVPRRAPSGCPVLARR